jgi:hypothetical protein
MIINRSNNFLKKLCAQSNPKRTVIYVLWREVKCVTQIKDPKEIRSHSFVVGEDLQVLMLLFVIEYY